MVDTHFGTPETAAPTLGLDQILCIRQSDGTRFSELVYALIEAGAVTIRGGVIEAMGAPEPALAPGVAVEMRTQRATVTLGELRSFVAALNGVPDIQVIEFLPADEDDEDHRLRVNVGAGWPIREQREHVSRGR